MTEKRSDLEILMEEQIKTSKDIAASGRAWESEHRFALTLDPPRQWRFDFAFPPQLGWRTVHSKDHHGMTTGHAHERGMSRGIAIEIEGGIYSGGAHTRGKHFESDAEKYNEATLLGWAVLRVTSAMVNDGRAIALLERALKII